MYEIPINMKYIHTFLFLVVVVVFNHHLIKRIYVRLPSKVEGDVAVNKT